MIVLTRTFYLKSTFNRLLNDRSGPFFLYPPPPNIQIWLDVARQPNPEKKKREKEIKTNGDGRNCKPEKVIHVSFQKQEGKNSFSEIVQEHFGAALFCSD